MLMDVMHGARGCEAARKMSTRSAIQVSSGIATHVNVPTLGCGMFCRWCANGRVRSESCNTGVNIRCSQGVEHLMAGVIVECIVTGRPWSDHIWQCPRCFAEAASIGRLTPLDIAVFGVSALWPNTCPPGPGKLWRAGQCDFELEQSLRCFEQDRMRWSVVIE